MTRELVVLVDIEMHTLDPHNLTAGAARRVAGNITPGLVRLGPGGVLEPALAEGWEVSRDGQTVTLRLVRGARFHTGRAVSADAVRENFARICAPDSTAFQRHEYGVIHAMEVMDAHALRFRLREPFAPFLGLLANGTGITDVQALEARDPKSSPVGAGPYELARWVAGQHLELRAFADYHRPGLPRVPQVLWRFVPQDRDRAQMLGQGRAHLSWAPALSSRDELTHRGVTVDLGEGHGPTYIAFNCTRPPFSDPRARLAIAHAVNRAGMVQDLFGGAGVASHTPFPPNSVWHAAISAPPYDPAHARSLLAAAGLGGQRHRFTLPVNGPGGAWMAARLAEDLAPIGIDLDIVPYPNPLWWPGVYMSRDWHLLLQTWAPMPDPDHVFGRRYHSRGIFNATGYASAEADSLIERGRHTIDPADRFAAYRDLQEVLIRDAPTIYLFHEPAVTAWAPGVSGFRPEVNAASWEMYIDAISLG
jgi:peptide/nickel transport system substrate-binding protein